MKTRIHSIRSARHVTVATLAALAFASLAAARADDDQRIPELPSPLCDSVQVPAGNKVAFHAYALGVQIYLWNGTAWVFVAPEAELFANPGYQGQIGIHYAGPTWESGSGSKVVGVRLAGCTPSPGTIPWLRLGAVSSTGPGIFDGVTYIQRVNTIGGAAPAASGSAVGEEARVPYTAEYYFYRGAQ